MTAVELDYIGSCAIDEDLMDAAKIKAYEQIHVWNINNGERFITYAMPAERGSGTISVNGSAARRASANDLLIIATFGFVQENEGAAPSPTIVFVDKNNRATARP